MTTKKSLRVRQVHFDELIERSDLLSIHVPLTQATKGMIGANTIARMKSGAIIVNGARGASSMRRRCMTRWSVAGCMAQGLMCS